MSVTLLYCSVHNNSNFEKEENMKNFFIWKRILEVTTHEKNMRIEDVWYEVKTPNTGFYGLMYGKKIPLPPSKRAIWIYLQIMLLLKILEKRHCFYCKSYFWKKFNRSFSFAHKTKKRRT